jgi:hypothetical protein
VAANVPLCEFTIETQFERQGHTSIRLTQGQNIAARREIEGRTGDEQRDRRVDEGHVLHVFTYQHRFGIKRIQDFRLLAIIAQ